MSYLPPIFQQNNQYSARVTRQLLDDVATEGVVGANAFAVTQRAAGAAMAVDVAAGRAYVRGTDQSNQGLYLCITEATVELPVEPADPSLDRIDLVVAEVRDPNAGGASGDDWQFRVIEGTPDASPVVPAVPASAIALAEIEVDANVTSILDADLTDRRAFSDAKSGGFGFTYAGTRYYTSSGTFDKADPLGTGDIGLRAIRVRVVGGGGGGGGVDSVSSGRRPEAGGGGGGGFSQKFILASSLSSSETVTRGAGGASTTNGGTSEFGTTPLLSATGGEGAPQYTLDTIEAATSVGGEGGVGSGGDLNVTGGHGASGKMVLLAGGTQVALRSGEGGGTFYANASRTTVTNQVGGAGVFPGGGGGGGAGQSGGAARAGGAGADGIVIIDCFV